MERNLLISIPSRWGFNLLMEGDFPSVLGLTQGRRRVGQTQFPGDTPDSSQIGGPDREGG